MVSIAPAKSSRTTCKICKKKIKKGELRATYTSWRVGYYPSNSYKCYECYRGPISWKERIG